MPLPYAVEVLEFDEDDESHFSFDLAGREICGISHDRQVWVRSDATDEELRKALWMALTLFAATLTDEDDDV